MSKVYIISILTGGILFISSCRKFIEQVPLPETELTRKLVFEEDATAIAAISGMYNQMAKLQQWSNGGTTSITLVMSLYTDELRSYSATSPFYLNNLVSTDAVVSSTWGSCYNLIYSANQIIDGINQSTKLSAGTRDQLMGEALFLRGFCHFYLLNLFGDVPYIDTADYIINSTVTRTSSAEVYQEIIADLISAVNYLPDNYPGVERVRVNKGAAIALLARAYLYNKEWANAEEWATAIIDKTQQYELLDDPDQVFLKNSRETIWQIIPGGDLSLFTEEGGYLILTTTPTNRVSLTNELFNAFEAGDQRKLKWVDTLTVGLSSWYYPYKYKQNAANGTGAEYSMVMRLAEQYLIRAEARAHLNKLTGNNSAASDMNVIRDRAGLDPATATTKEQLLVAIEQERRVELFTEWGHRFFDLKRNDRLDAVLTGVKPNWDSNDKYWPIPHSEILANKKLTQNNGY